MMEHLKVRVEKDRNLVIVRHDTHKTEQAFLLEDIEKLTYSFVKVWTEALRSGEYDQTNGALIASFNGHYKYCCLGVAAVCRGYTPSILNGAGHLHSDSVEGKLMRLPKVMRESSNINNAFASLNDGMGLNFEEIAYLIEEMYKQVNILNDNYPNGTAIN